MRRARGPRAAGVPRSWSPYGAQAARLAQECVSALGDVAELAASAWLRRPYWAAASLYCLLAASARWARAGAEHMLRRVASRGSTPYGEPAGEISGLGRGRARCARARARRRSSTCRFVDVRKPARARPAASRACCRMPLGEQQPRGGREHRRVVLGLGALTGSQRAALSAAGACSCAPRSASQTQLHGARLRRRTTSPASFSFASASGTASASACSARPSSARNVGAHSWRSRARTR